MNIVLLGAPGVGKGTCADILSKRYRVPHISTGDIFREAIATKTPLGNKVKKYLDRGELVPDELTIAVVKQRLEREDCKKGFLLDGYPRTIAQAEALKKFARVYHILNFVAEKKTIVERLSGRRICRKCGTIYHLKYAPPKQQGKCKCSGELFQRSDETPDVVMKRLIVYEEQTKPLIDYYRNEGILSDIDANYGMEELDKIIKQCEEALKRNG